MAQNLINYPIIDYDNETGWRDSGEGGMFFYAVWDAVEAAECIVDVAPSMNMADVLVAAHGPLTENFADQKRAWSEWVDKRNYKKAYQESGISFDTVLLLGTTSISYFGEDYFAVRSLDDLTEAGQTLVNSISAFMGTEPTFVSYLDT